MIELDETFAVRLSEPVAATIADVRRSSSIDGGSMMRAAAGRWRRLGVAATASTMAACLVALAPPVSAATDDLVLASTSDTGIKGDRGSFAPVLSADGGTAAFASDATNLDPADTDPFTTDIYVKDLANGNIALASTSDTGTKGNGTSLNPSLSADGITVAFQSFATNLDPADRSRSSDIYVKDLASGNIVLASTSDTGTKGNGTNFNPSLSADGTTVAFASQATNLDPADTDANIDVYVKHLSSGEIVLASTSDTGIKGNGSSFNPSLSADGSTVAFDSLATNLDPADSESFFDVYVKDLVSADIVLASTSDAGVKGQGSLPSLSADGTMVAFQSNATNLDPADSDPLFDIYVKNVRSGDIVLVSTSAAGAKTNGSSFAPSLAADGTTVAFDSQATNLDPHDPDPISDVYVKELTSGHVVLASTSDTGAKGNGISFDAALSRDGSAVTFTSQATNLDPADSDPLADVYVRTRVPPLTVSIRDRTVTEGDTGTRNAVFVVTLSAASSTPVTVRFDTADGTATAPTDYRSQSGTVTFAPGQTRRVIVVAVAGDRVTEPTETFAVRMFTPSGATISDGRGIGRILDND